MTVIGHHAALELAAAATAHHDDYIHAAEDSVTGRRPRTRARAARLAAVLAVQSADDVPSLTDVIRSLDAEIQHAHQRRDIAVHEANAQARCAESAEDALRAFVDAYGRADDAALERAMFAAISHLSGRSGARIREAAIASALEAQAYRATKTTTV